MSGESLRDRLSGLSRGELVGLALLVLGVLAAAAFWYLRSLPEPVDVRALRAAPPSGSATPVATPAAILVHVAGAVRKPGVYEFHEGDRVIDAIQAAGGATGRADFDGLNLAAPLTDGSQVAVPEHVSGAIGPGPAVGEAEGETGALVNVNTATTDQLEGLPGIGEVLAQAIVDYRTESGPFASVDQLEDVSGIGPSILEDIRDLVTV